MKHLHFNDKIDQRSPIQDDFARKVNYDEDGNEFITYEKVDYPTFQRSLGKVGDWSLENLLKAGISPDFPISTGYNTRLAGLNDLNSVSSEVQAYADEVFGNKE